MLCHMCVSKYCGLGRYILLGGGGVHDQGEGWQSDMDYSSPEAMLQQRNWVSKSTYLWSPENYYYFVNTWKGIKSKPNDTKINGLAKSPLQKVNSVDQVRFFQ